MVGKVSGERCIIGVRFENRVGPFILEIWGGSAIQRRGILGKKNQ